VPILRIYGYQSVKSITDEVLGFVPFLPSPATIGIQVRIDAHCLLPDFNLRHRLRTATGRQITAVNPTDLKRMANLPILDQQVGDIHHQVDHLGKS
jgi:hypothetical protein